MFDIGAMELFLVAVLALVVVGPKELPKLLRTVGGFVRKIRELASEFKDGVEELAAEADRQTDPFADLRKKEGLRPGMSPEEITNHIMSNRGRETASDKDSEKRDKASDQTTGKDGKPDGGST